MKENLSVILILCFWGASMMAIAFEDVIFAAIFFVLLLISFFIVLGANNLFWLGRWFK
jgi:hypothetical protein